MLSVEGTFRDGLALPAEAVDGPDGPEVFMILIAETTATTADTPGGYDSPSRLIEECQVNAGTGDLALQHDQ